MIVILYDVQVNTNNYSIVTLLMFDIEATLTTQNLQEIFKEVDEEKWDLIGRKLRLPKSKRDKIKSDYESDSERKGEILKSYAVDHPYPNWLHVADLLRGLDYAKQANQISVKYLSKSKTSVIDSYYRAFACDVTNHVMCGAGVQLDHCTVYMV